jgi:hypothetical protein
LRRRLRSNIQSGVIGSAACSIPKSAKETKVEQDEGGEGGEAGEVVEEKVVERPSTEAAEVEETAEEPPRVKGRSMPRPTRDSKEAHAEREGEVQDEGAVEALDVKEESLESEKMEA